MKKLLNLLGIKWVSEEWREGSMGAADKKSAFRYCGIGTIVLFLIYSCMYFFNTDLHMFYQIHGTTISHIISVITALGSVYFLWKSPDTFGATWHYWFGVFGLAAATLLIGCGFNFTYPPGM